MAILMAGSSPPPPNYENLIVNANDSVFDTTLGAWTNSGGTMTRDTGNKWTNLNASLKWASTAQNQYVELPIAGTFKVGVEYVCMVAIKLEEQPAAISMAGEFGLIGTDSAGDSVTGIDPAAYELQYTNNIGYMVYAMRWVPTATRTGVKFRWSRPGAESGTATWHIGWIKAFRLPLKGGHASIADPAQPSVNAPQLVAMTSFTGWQYHLALSEVGGLYMATRGGSGLDHAMGKAGYQISRLGGLYMFGEDGGGTGDVSDKGVNIEAGPDYVGLWLAEKDDSTLQMYADFPNGYMMQLRHRGNGKGWSVSDDGAVNARIEAFFQHTLTVAGALTTGTDKASQRLHLPRKSRVDEVRCHVGTSPTGTPIIVDVNANGTTIFTTQANRPRVGVDVKNLTSGGGTTDAMTFVTASVSMKAGRLYLMSVENSHGTSAAAVQSITGSGPGADNPMTSRSTTQYNGNLNRTSIWSCVATTDWTGTITITFASAQTGCVWSLDEVTGADTATNDGVVQQAVGTGNNTTPTVTLGAFATAENGAYAAHGHAAAAATTPGSGWTELGDATTTTPSQALQTEFRPDNDTSADATIASAQWGSCAVELKAAASGNSREPDGGTSLAKDSIITMDIDQIGSGTAGSDLTVFVRGRYIW